MDCDLWQMSNSVTNLSPVGTATDIHHDVHHHHHP
jgi:hypothetical protein